MSYITTKIEPDWVSDCGRVVLHQGDCRGVMAGMEADSHDSIVTDPPYGLSFMGKGWDHGVPGIEFWGAALRVAKPGAHLLAFGGTRTHHRLMCAIEDAGWEIRDCLMWVYGSGFPKSLNVGKAIDKAAGAEREIIGGRKLTGTARIIGGQGSATSGKADLMYRTHKTRDTLDITAPATDSAKFWDGWGTALKPAWEPIILARKPLDGTVANNAQRHGTGALNIDGCRIPTNEDLNGGGYDPAGSSNKDLSEASSYAIKPIRAEFKQPAGRWPANLIHDGSDEVVGLFPAQTGKSAGMQRTTSSSWLGTRTKAEDKSIGFGDSGSAARFFYCAKASKRDRDEGLNGFSKKGVQQYGTIRTNRGKGYEESSTARNHHPTVKPTDLMAYLVRLITPPGGTVLDPFMGSGSTGKAAVREGFNFTGIDLDESDEYVEIAKARILGVLGSNLFAEVSA